MTDVSKKPEETIEEQVADEVNASAAEVQSTDNQAAAPEKKKEAKVETPDVGKVLSDILDRMTKLEERPVSVIHVHRSRKEKSDDVQQKVVRKAEGKESGSESGGEKGKKPAAEKRTGFHLWRTL